MNGTRGIAHFAIHSRMTAFAIGIFLLAADYITKYLTQKYIPLIAFSSPEYPYGGIAVFKDFLGIEFSIVHTTNRGAAWGMFSDFQHYLIILRIVLIIGVLAYFLWINQRKSWLIPLALIISGATGNVIDYFLYGHVVDMLHFKFWGYSFAVFNVADSAVTVGIIWLLLLSTFEKGDAARSS